MTSRLCATLCGVLAAFVCIESGARVRLAPTTREVMVVGSLYLQLIDAYLSCHVSQYLGRRLPNRAIKSNASIASDRRRRSAASIIRLAPRGLCVETTPFATERRRSAPASSVCSAFPRARRDVVASPLPRLGAVDGGVLPCRVPTIHPLSRVSRPIISAGFSPRSSQQWLR